MPAAAVAENRDTFVARRRRSGGRRGLELPVRRRTHNARIGLVLPLLGLGSCALFSSEDSLVQVDELVGWVERVHVNAEVAKERVRSATDSLSAMVAPGFDGDAVQAYAALAAAIEHSDKQGKELKASVDGMKKAAEPVFRKWKQDLAEFSSPEMKKRSEARFAAARERYDAVVAAVEPAVAQYEAFNKTMRDHALFLGHDFNAAAISELEGDVRAVSGRADELDRQFTICLSAARAYVDSAALPMRVERQRLDAPARAAR
jgi:hypothetical protein